MNSGERRRPPLLPVFEMAGDAALADAQAQLSPEATRERSEDVRGGATKHFSRF